MSREVYLLPHYKPYLTDDGSIGLYSYDFSDIFHSRTGALSEAYEKFVIPADVSSVLKSYNEINLLDVCYGIGYNSKAFLNFIIKKIIEKRLFTNKPIVSRCTDNINSKLKNTETIYTDNYSIVDHIFNNECRTNLFNEANSFTSVTSEFTNSEASFHNFQYDITNINIPKINIDAIELEREFVYLSPFIKENCYKQEYKIANEINFIILDRLMNKYNSKVIDQVRRMRTVRNYFRFFSIHDILNKLSFYHDMINYTSSPYKKRLLHNIYYRYISKKSMPFRAYLSTMDYQYILERYNALYSLLNKNIDINFYFDDARRVLPDLGKKYNIIFLDAFTPAKAPSLWTVEFINKLSSKLTTDGVILTYSNSARVRTAMKICGLHLGTLKNNDGIQFGTIASFAKNKISSPLSFEDIARINSKSGIPYRDKGLMNDDKTILERLENEITTSNLPTLSKALKGVYNEKV